MSHFLKRNAYANVKIENEVTLAMEREQRIQKDIEEAVGTRRDIENDIDEIRRHKADLLEPQLIQSIKDLKVYI